MCKIKAEEQRQSYQPRHCPNPRPLVKRRSVLPSPEENKYNRSQELRHTNESVLSGDSVPMQQCYRENKNGRGNLGVHPQMQKMQFLMCLFLILIGGYQSAALTDEPSVVPSIKSTDAPSKIPTIAPSKTPTKAPTDAPTDKPSIEPTKSPTKTPTEVPTKAPSDTPSKTPTRVPTNIPSKAPTEMPTKSPSKMPSKTPTEMPSESPSKTPTEVPTESPSKTPTKVPTGIPSTAPTNPPTEMPTKTPSKSPTTMPSYGPTASLSKSPSTSPSKQSSTSPTASPSGSPTVSPSKLPTVAPSNPPTASPTLSKIPSNLPTKNPTVSPTESPSKDPTGMPSTLPSASSQVPSALPTKSNFPTNLPTEVPSKSPTTAPSTSPSMASESPSNIPTEAPSKEPTLVPTHLPSLLPSISLLPSDLHSSSPSTSSLPSNSPTGNPSLSPTKMPTKLPSYRPSNAPSTAPSETVSYDPTSSPSATTSTSPSIAHSTSPTTAPTNLPTTHVPSASPTLMPSTAPTTAPTKMPSTRPSNSPTTSTAPSLLPSNGPSIQPKKTLGISATESPSTSPSIMVVVLSSSISVELNLVTGIMDDSETRNGFESACNSFLSDLFKDTSPPINDLKCTVKGQRLVDGSRFRSLKNSGLNDFRSNSFRQRQLAESFPLEVDIDVTGRFIPTDSFKAEKDVPFDQYLNSFFKVHDDKFVDELQDLVTDDLILYFADVKEVGVIDLQNSEPQTGTANRSIGGGDPNNGPIIAAAVGGCVAFILFVGVGGFLCRRSRDTKHRELGQDQEKLFLGEVKGSRSDDVDSAASPPRMYGGSDGDKSSELGSQSYAYSLDHGIGSVGNSSSFVSFSQSMASFDEGSSQQYNNKDDLVSPHGDKILQTGSYQSHVTMSPDSVEVDIIPEEPTNDITISKEGVSKETFNDAPVRQLAPILSAGRDTKSQTGDKITKQQQTSSNLISSIITGDVLNDQSNEETVLPSGKSPVSKAETDSDGFELYENVSDILGSQSLNDDLSKSAPAKEGTVTGNNAVENSGLVQRDCYAPPGKLGVIIDSSSSGPIVHDVKPGSALEGVLFSGDRIVAVDGIDTRGKTAGEVTSIMATRIDATRKITVLGVPSATDI